MHELTLLKDLSVVMVAAAVTTLGCHLLKQPVVLGYLLAGVIIGPFTPPFALVNDMHSIETLAEIGLIFLMFAIGLEFNLPRLRKVGMSAALAAVLEVVGMVGIGYWLGQLFGWSRLDSFYLGAILSISSTTIIAKVFTDLKLVKEEFAQVVFGILVLEDVVAIVLLTLLSGLGASRVEGAMAVKAFGRVIFFVILFLVAGLALVPRIVRWVAHFKSRELLGIVVLGLCLASALLANHFGFSIALGAFLMGSIVGITMEIDTIEEWFHPIRDMFSAIFFVSTGLLIQPRLVWDNKEIVFIIVAVTIVGKVIAGASGSFLAGYSLKTSFKAGMSLAQIGEFSFVIAGLALKDKMASDFLYPIAVAVSALTALSTPYLIRGSDSAVDRGMKTLGPRWTHRLDRYHLWVASLFNDNPLNTNGISRYLVRLGIYGAILIAAFSLATLSTAMLVGMGWMQILAWVASFLLCLPLIQAVTTYASHFILVGFTESLVRLNALNVLQILPVHRFYSATYWALAAILAGLFLLRSGVYLESQETLYKAAGASALIALAVRTWYSKAYDWLESLLDEVLGLATSEPLRQAALKTEEAGEGISQSLERVYIDRLDGAVKQSILSLKLRAKSGASLVALYRQGKLFTNPAPDMILLSGDTVVLLGDKEERAKARQLLKRLD